MISQEKLIKKTTENLGKEARIWLHYGGRYFGRIKSIDDQGFVIQDYKTGNKYNVKFDWVEDASFKQEIKKELNQ